MIWANPSGKFQLIGGRGGELKFSRGDSTFEIEWEMLVGEVKLAVYASSLSSAPTSSLTLAAQDLRAIIQEFVDESKLRTEIWWGDKFEIIEPV